MTDVTPAILAPDNDHRRRRLHLGFIALTVVAALILVIAVFDTFRRWKAYKAGGESAQVYYRVKPTHRLMILAVYLGLIAVCVVGMGLTFIERSIPS